LNRDERDRLTTFATIQSIVNPALRGELPAPDLIIVDEAHRVPHKTGEQGQYERLLLRYPSARRIAMTATPWRTDDGLIYGAGEQFWFDRRAYAYTVPQGVMDGYLSPIVGVETEVQLTLPDPPSTGDFVMSEVEKDVDNAWLESVAHTLLQVASARKHLAVYCPTVLAAERAAAVLGRVTGYSAGTVTGAMNRVDRAEALHRFRSGEFRILCSVDTLTTGWDFPALDCIVCLRPTTASNLWVQILGRGTRLAEGKKNCLLLDFVGNLQRLGGVDTLETYVRQGDPLEPIEAVPQVRKTPVRTTLPGLTSLIPLDPTTGEHAREGARLTVKVHAVGCVALNTRRGAALMVQYTCSTPENARVNASLFLPTGRPNAQVSEFFTARKLAVRLPADPASLQWQVRGARTPEYVTVKKSGKYWNTVEEHWNTTQEELQ
jgi:DNA repair protein RadD